MNAPQHPNVPILYFQQEQMVTHPVPDVNTTKPQPHPYRPSHGYGKLIFDSRRKIQLSMYLMGLVLERQSPGISAY
jgi:hypothetical protein